jgi:hypothetical protein
MAARPWANGGGPDGEEVRRLVEDEGYTDRQLAEHYGVSEPTARYYRIREGILKPDAPDRIDHRATGAIPWELDTKQGHHSDPLARVLRNRNRMRHGKYVAPELARQVERLEEDLAAEDAVIDYNREIGFHTRKRDPKIDDPDNIVRVPPAEKPKRRGAA